jgi:hypothetical protein
MKRTTRRPRVSTHERLARQRAGVARVLNALKAGASLHLAYQDGRATWRLSPGPPVTPEIAGVITHSPNVVALGDSLFPNHPGQTWRYVNDQESIHAPRR